MTLEGARVFIAQGAASPLGERVWAWLESELGRRGAAVARTVVSEEPCALADLTKRALGFAPSAFVCGWSEAAASLAARTEIPTIHLASVSADPQVVLGAAPRGVVVWTDPPETAEGLVCPLPSLAVGSLTPRPGVAITAEAAGGSPADPTDPIDTLSALLLEARAVLRNAEARTGEANADVKSVSPPELVDFLHTSSPRGLFGRDQVAALVDQAIELGMPVSGERPFLLLDPYESYNWLSERSASFREQTRSHRRTRERAGLTPEARVGRPCCEHSGGPARHLDRAQRCRVTFRIDVDTSHLENGSRYRIYLPYPIVAETQRDVAIVSTRPEGLSGGLAPELGYFYGVEGRVEGKNASFGYTADLTNAELHVPVPPERRRSAPPAESSEELLLHALRATDDPVQRAFFVYDWMSTVGRVRKVWRACACPKCSAEHFDAAHEGDCILLAHAFVAYCERLGVTARPVRGALFDAPLDDGGVRFGVSRPGQSIACHTWAEFEAPELGWVPVEFLASCLRPVSPSACWDDDLGRTLAADHAFLREHYFGSLDNQRILYSRSVLAIPYVTSYDLSRPRGSRWARLDADRIRFHHEVELLDPLS